ncbi:hypothetical protein AZE42_09215 [Rhizopogon vesiculosus]|uniref:F-box domain-containing protein n=1 Tax=Rhizopogon vesiculosus TaxID=180088 RepID=A0A1J8Q6F4_9AGAM|nr:hypothetical protein AZE42_09215 [Rhizopogon vesiculosus]
MTNSQHQEPLRTFQVRRNISTGIGFCLNPSELFPDSQLSHSDKARESTSRRAACGYGLFPDSQLSHSDKAREDVDEREGCLRTWREGVLGGEGVAGNTIRVKGMSMGVGVLEGLRAWVPVGGGGVDVSGRGRGRQRRVLEPKTLRRGLRIVAVRKGLTLIELRVDDDHRLRSWWDFLIGWQEEEWEPREERGVSESVLARGRYTSSMGVSGRRGAQEQRKGVNKWTPRRHRTRPVPPEEEVLRRRDQVPRYQMEQTYKEGSAQPVAREVTNFPHESILIVFIFFETFQPSANKMRAIEVKANPEVKPPPISETIDSILASSQAIVCVFRFNLKYSDMTYHIDDFQIPDLETPYSRFSNNNLYESAIGQDQSIRVIITERQQQLDAVLHDISDLDIVMDKIKSLRHRLVEKRGKVKQSMDLHKGLISALWRLPAEILSQIFVHCLPTETDLGISLRLDPLLLTRICRRWREVAMDTPSLWCNLSVNISWKQSAQWPQAAFCYDSWLRRSQGLPLSLTRVLYDDDDKTKVQSLLQPYLKQITSIAFPTTKAYQLLALDLPTLQELIIENLSHDSAADARSISRLPCNLRSLRLQGPPGFDFQQSCSSNPVWVHLTNLEICVNKAETFICLLQLCLNISSATVSMLPSEFYFLPQSKPFTHTKLQFLSILSSHSPFEKKNSIARLFNGLYLPNLRMLHCNGYDGYGIWWPHNDFKVFLAQSNCPLERLTLGPEVTTDEQRAEYITIIPSLEIVGGR